MSTLRGKITLNTKAFQQGIKRVKAMAQRLGSELVTRFKTAGKVITVGLAGASLAAGLVIGKVATQTLKTGDEIHKMGLRTGFTAEELTRLKHAAELSGTTIEGIEDTVKDMQKNLVDASQGSVTMREQFKLLNLNVEELINLSPEEQFKRITSALADVNDPTQRAAISMRIFGEGGRRLIPMLAEGSAGLEKMKADADKLGITMSGKQVQNLAAFNDSISRLGKSLLGLFQKALGFEDLRLLTDQITEAIIRFRESTFFATTIKNIQNLVSSVIAMGSGILNVITKADENFWKFAGRVGAAALAAGVAFKSGLMIPIFKALTILYTAITAISIGEALEESFDLSTRFARIMATMSSGFDNIMTLIAGKLEALTDEEIGEQLLERDTRLKEQLDNLTVETRDFVETLKTKINENNEGLKNVVGSLLGTDDLDGTIDDILGKYKQGVKDFEQISIDNKKNQIDLGADQQINQFGQLKKQIEDVRKEAGKQVSFFVDLDQLKQDRLNSGRSGGVTSRAIREAGAFFRDQISLKKFKENFQSVGNRFRRGFNGQDESENPTTPGIGVRQRVRAGGATPARRGNIAQNVEAKTTQLSELISLTKSANETRSSILTAITKLSGGFGSV